MRNTLLVSHRSYLEFVSGERKTELFFLKFDEQLGIEPGRTVLLKDEETGNTQAAEVVAIDMSSTYKGIMSAQTEPIALPLSIVNFLDSRAEYDYVLVEFAILKDEDLNEPESSQSEHTLTGIVEPERIYNELLEYFSEWKDNDETCCIGYVVDPDNPKISLLLNHIIANVFNPECIVVCIPNDEKRSNEIKEIADKLIGRIDYIEADSLINSIRQIIQNGYGADGVSLPLTKETRLIANDNPILRRMLRTNFLLPFVDLDAKELSDLYDWLSKKATY